MLLSTFRWRAELKLAVDSSHPIVEAGSNGDERPGPYGHKRQRSETVRSNDQPEQTERKSPHHHEGHLIQPRRATTPHRLKKLTRPMSTGQGGDVVIRHAL